MNAGIFHTNKSESPQLFNMHNSPIHNVFIEGKHAKATKTESKKHQETEMNGETCTLNSTMKGGKRL
jgi:hypothetical protein